MPNVERKKKKLEHRKIEDNDCEKVYVMREKESGQTGNSDDSTGSTLSCSGVSGTS